MTELKKHSSTSLVVVRVSAHLDWRSMGDDYYAEYACQTCCIEHVFVGERTLAEFVREQLDLSDEQTARFTLTISDPTISARCSWKGE